MFQTRGLPKAEDFSPSARASAAEGLDGRRPKFFKITFFLVFYGLWPTINYHFNFFVFRFEITNNCKIFLALKLKINHFSVFWALEKSMICKFVNYKIMNCKDPLYHDPK